MRSDCEIAVVGAGAAGLTAAIWAAGSGADVIALDGAPKIGAKILISGGGRCNVTHRQVTAADFNGNRNTIGRILRSFPVDETVRWFERLGVALVTEETGKLFPSTNRARTVVDALVDACRAQIVTRARVSAVHRTQDGFDIETTRGRVSARRVVLATGGQSVPQTGSDGSGFALARALGHSVTPLFPALVPLVVEKGFWTTGLSGTSVDAELQVLSATGRKLHAARGSLLLTHFGLSGPVTLDISRHWIAARRDDPAARLVASFLPDHSLESVEAHLHDALKANPRATLHSALRGKLPERLLDRLAPHAALAQLSKDQRRATVRSIVESTIPIQRDRGFGYAEVTAGGVPLSEIDPATMESRVCPGLYLCGEVLDVDGRIGGFNFQWAWASGRQAGTAAAHVSHNR